MIVREPLHQPKQRRRGRNGGTNSCVMTWTQTLPKRSGLEADYDAQVSELEAQRLQLVSCILLHCMHLHTCDMP